MVPWKGISLALVIGLVGIITSKLVTDLYVPYLKLGNDQLYAMLTKHHAYTTDSIDSTVTPSPSNAPQSLPSTEHFDYHVRLRDWDNQQTFFQWWNYLIYDIETDTHININMNLNRYTDKVPIPPSSAFALGVLQGEKLLFAANMGTTADNVEHTGYAGITMRTKSPIGDTDSWYSHNITNNQASLHGDIIVAQDCASTTNTTYIPHADGQCYARVQWNASVWLVHGGYNSVDVEEGKPFNPNATAFPFHKSDLPMPESIPGADPSAPCECGSSILYGYDSVAKGQFSVSAYNPSDVANSAAAAPSASQTFLFALSDRYRVYAGASYGCTLPNGDVPVENPWSWVWQVTPEAMLKTQTAGSGAGAGAGAGAGDVAVADEVYVANARKTDTSFVIGDARFDTGAGATGTIYGGYMFAKVSGQPMVDARYARLRDTRAFVGSDQGAQAPVVDIEDIVYSDVDRLKDTMSRVNKESKKTIGEKSGVVRSDTIDQSTVEFPVVSDDSSPVSALYNNIPVMATSLQGYLSAFNVTKHRWVEWSDDMGVATVPLTQVFTVETQHKLISLNATVKPEQIFRAVVPLYTANRGFQLFSDFRSVAPLIETKVYNKVTVNGTCPILSDSCHSKSDTCLDKTVTMSTPYGNVDVHSFAIEQNPDDSSVFPRVHSFFRKLLNIPGQTTCSIYTPQLAYSQRGMNAVEYAYVSPVDVDLEYLFAHPGDYLGAVRSYQNKKKSTTDKNESKSSLFAEASADDELASSARGIPWSFGQPALSEWTDQALYEHFESMIPLTPALPEDADEDTLAAAIAGIQRVGSYARSISDGLIAMINNDFSKVPEILQIPEITKKSYIEVAYRLDVSAADAADQIDRQIAVGNARIKALQRLEYAKKIIAEQAKKIEDDKQARLEARQAETARLQAELREKQEQLEAEYERKDREARAEHDARQAVMTEREKVERAGKLYRRAMREMGSDVEKYAFEDIVAMYEAIVVEEDRIMEGKLEGWEAVQQKRLEWQQLMEEQTKYAQRMMSEIRDQEENSNELPRPSTGAPKDEL